MIEEKGYGKINLALHIVGQRHDGYHEIDTVFQTIGLYDTITIEEADDVELTCSVSSLPCDKTNLAYKAYAALLPYRKGPAGVHIHIEKRIPIAAGLAGGSTDCAAVLRGLNRIWGLQLSQDELCRIGATLGADVPFCIRGGTMRGHGIGEILRPLPGLPAWDVIVVHPHAAVHTGKAYALFDTGKHMTHIDVDAVERAICHRDFEGLVAAMGNTFESLVIPGMPILQSCRRLLRKVGLTPFMAGSGPTMFALVPPQAQVRSLFDRLCQEAKDVDMYMSTLVMGGV